MDGTLIDTETIATACWKQVFKYYNVPFDEPTIMSLKGAGRITAKAVFDKTYKGHPTYEDGRKMRSELVDKYIKTHPIPVLKGVREFLDYLKEHNYKIALATSSKPDYSNFVLTKTDLLKYFSFFVYGNEVKIGKPNPEIFLLAAKKTDSLPDECLIVEDSKYGIQAGYDGGFKICGIPNAYPFSKETKAMCTYICPSMDELRNLFIEEEEKAQR